MMLLQEKLDHARPINIAPPFNRHAARYDAAFEEVHASTPALKEECFRLRHQVYCVERQFESALSNPPGLERDVYDERSDHSLLFHRPTGIAIGTVRLVLNVAGGKQLDPLPFHLVCDDPRARDSEFLPADLTAEVSRFAISKERTQMAFQRAAQLGAYHVDSATCRMSVLGLLRMALEMAAANGVQYLCAIMEPALVRHLASFGVEFKPLGGLVEYHGRRQPCYASIGSLIEHANSRDPELCDFLTNQEPSAASTALITPVRLDNGGSSAGISRGIP